MKPEEMSREMRIAKRMMETAVEEDATREEILRAAMHISGSVIDTLTRDHQASEFEAALRAHLDLFEDYVIALRLDSQSRN